MTAVDLTLTPLRTGLLAGHATALNVLVRARAPSHSARLRARRRLNLALVIDRSGSMRGRPLGEAKRAARFIVDGLDSSDLASLVVYDNRVDVLVPNAPVGNREALREAISSIHTGGCTALYDGWRLGADQALLGQDGESLSRVLLLSDGMANRGLSDTEQIAKRVASVADSGVSTSTYGLGHGFNEELMMAMARAGGGNGYYGESARDLLDPFNEELDLLNSLCAHNLRLSLEAPEGVGISVLNGYTQDGAGRWRLPELAYGGEAWALVELRVPARLQPGNEDDSIEILRAVLDMDSPNADETTASPARLRLPFLPANAFAALAEDETVRRRGQEIRAASMQEEARMAARRGQWGRVDQILHDAQIEAEENPWLQGSLDALERYAHQRKTESFSKEAMYTSDRLRSRLTDPEEVSGQYDLGLESDKASYLRRKPEQGKRLDPRSDNSS